MIVAIIGKLGNRKRFSWEESFSAPVNMSGGDLGRRMTEREPRKGGERGGGSLSRYLCPSRRHAVVLMGWSKNGPRLRDTLSWLPLTSVQAHRT